MSEPAVGAGLVHRYLGVSAMAGCVLGTLLTIPCQFLVGRAMSRNNSAIMQVTTTSCSVKLYYCSILIEASPPCRLRTSGSRPALKHCIT